MKLNLKNGQSLIEILVAIGVGTIMLLGAITALAPVIKSQTDVNRGQVGATLGKELLDNVRIFAESNWHNLDSLATTSANKYFITAATSSMWSATGTEAVLSGPPASDFIGYWKFDEATGTVVSDFSGNGNTGTAYGTSVVSGKAGNARSFNGASDYIDLGNNPLYSSDVQTVSFWLMNKGTNKTAYLLDRSNNVDIWGYHGIVYSGGNLMVTENSNGGEHQTAITYGNLNSGSHLTFVYDWPKVYFYLNGDLYTTLTFTNHFDTGSTYKTTIGRSGEYANYFFDGAIDELRIYNRAFSASEVKSIYNATTFYRDFYVDNVYRDSGGNIVNVGGGLDPSTRKVTVEYYWGSMTPKTLFVYLTRFGNRTLWQTDWSGGAGANGPASSTGNSFSTSSGIDVSTSTGSIRINGL